MQTAGQGSIQLDNPNYSPLLAGRVLAQACWSSALDGAVDGVAERWRRAHRGWHAAEGPAGRELLADIINDTAVKGLRKGYNAGAGLFVDGMLLKDLQDVSCLLILSMVLR